MIALHVPSSFAKYKNKLTRTLYKVGRKTSNIDVRKEWSFLDDLKSISADAPSQSFPDSRFTRRSTTSEKTKTWSRRRTN